MKTPALWISFVSTFCYLYNQYLIMDVFPLIYVYIYIIYIYRTHQGITNSLSPQLRIAIVLLTVILLQTDPSNSNWLI